METEKVQENGVQQAPVANGKPLTRLSKSTSNGTKDGNVRGATRSEIEQPSAGRASLTKENETSYFGRRIEYPQFEFTEDDKMRNLWNEDKFIPRRRKPMAMQDERAIREGERAYEETYIKRFKVPTGHKYKMLNRNWIFKIPRVLSRHTPEAYVPHMFSIGPWHFKRSGGDTDQGQKIKHSYFEEILSQYDDPDSKSEQLQAAVNAITDRARACYEGPIGVTKEEFSEILLMDGCFIIEFLCRYHAENKRIKRRDPIFDKAYMLKCLRHDLILLENQVPWFVLECLYNLIKLDDDRVLLPPLSELVLHCFKGLFTDGSHLIDKEPSFVEEPILHIVDLLWRFLLCSLLEDGMNENEVRFDVGGESDEPVSELQMKLPSASRLREAGVKFKKGNSKSILIVKFENGVFKIPHLSVHDTSEAFLRNLIAFEQCCPSCEHPLISSYAKIMDNLIDTTDDLEILCKSGIICNLLDPKHAVQLFNRLYRDTSNDGLYYCELYKEVNSYRQKWHRKWRAFYIQNYFTKPWAIVSQFVAVLVITATLLQVYTGFKQLEPK